MEDSYTVHTGLWDSQQGEEMGDESGQWIFAPRKKSSHGRFITFFSNSLEQHV